AGARRQAAALGYPVLVKAAGGGGGSGMRTVASEDELAAALAAAAREAEAAFGDGRVYVEKLLRRPRHVEVQVLGDRHGQLVHLGERECSIQRRHQKIVEETPCPVLTPRLRAEMTAAALAASPPDPACASTPGWRPAAWCPSSTTPCSPRSRPGRRTGRRPCGGSAPRSRRRSCSDRRRTSPSCSTSSATRPSSPPTPTPAFWPSISPSGGRAGRTRRPRRSRRRSPSRARRRRAAGTARRRRPRRGRRSGRGVSGRSGRRAVDIRLRYAGREQAIRLVPEDGGFVATVDGRVHRVAWVASGGRTAAPGGTTVEEHALEVDGRVVRTIVAGGDMLVEITPDGSETE